MRVEAYWSQRLRLWVAYRVDERGNQIGDCGYGASRERAIADLD